MSRCDCPKRLYSSVKQARQAHRRQGARIRVYPCPDGPGYHVTNQDKHAKDGPRSR